MTSASTCKEEIEVVSVHYDKGPPDQNEETALEEKPRKGFAIIPSLSQFASDRVPLGTISNGIQKADVKKEPVTSEPRSMSYDYKLIADAQRRRKRVIERINNALDEWKPTVHAGGIGGTAIESPVPAANGSSEETEAIPSIQIVEPSQTPRSQDVEDTYTPDAYQQAAISAAEAGESFFLTGSAGTGKSFVLKKVIKLLRAKHLEVAVTASTGCAAVAINGNTVHSATGVGLGLDPAEVLQHRARTCSRMRDMLNSIDVLILDEVSMIDSYLFDKLELIFSTARAARQGRGTRRKMERARKKRRIDGEPQQKAFGGVQVIVCGDFFQLPPVAASDYKLQYTKEKYFAFEAAAWKKTIKKTVMLRVVHRQSDRNFVGLLNEIRHGVVSEYSLDVLEACQISKREDNLEIKPNGDPVPFTKLYSHRKQVEMENYMRLHNIKQYPGVKYIARDEIEYDELGAMTAGVVKALLHQLPGLDITELKERCRVLCLKNIDKDKGIVNGSAGYIVGFQLPDEAKQMSVKEWENMTPRERQKRYEELANGKGNRKLSLLDKEMQEKFQLAPRDPVSGFLTMDGENPDIMPVVRFDNGVEMAMAPQRWDVYGLKGQVVAWRSQIPLTLGWAMSIHKAQGMSLENVQTELARAFDFGQVYVALSRATSAQGLRLTSFDRNRVMTHDKVLAFYAEAEQEDVKRGRKLETGNDTDSKDSADSQATG